MNQHETVQAMIEVGRRLDQLGYVPATDGNISVRLSSREILATTSGVKKGFLLPRDFVVIDPLGQVLRGVGRPSTEIQMHLRIYHDRPDAMAVVHAHPPTATGFAVAGIPLTACVLPEVVATIGAVPLAPYATPSTADLPESIAPFIRDHDAILLANHGVVVFAPTLFDAANRMETVEQFAKILHVATTLGQVNRHFHIQDLPSHHFVLVPSDDGKTPQSTLSLSQPVVAGNGRDFGILPSDRDRLVVRVVEE